jgi:hypothetical protein
MKKNISHGLLVALLSAVLAGCGATMPTNQAMLTYETQPLGATIYEGGTALGVAPVTRTYQAKDAAAKTIQTPEVTAVWASGAKASFWTNLDVGADRVATIERPAGAPGLETDLAKAQPLMDAKSREEQRKKEETQRDLNRDSARCREQQKGNRSTVNDC